jgi:hypothetical protein
MRHLFLAAFTIGMMLALHPLPREPWGMFGMGDLFTGYVLAFVSGTAYATLAVRRRARPRATAIANVFDQPEERRKAA